MGWTPISEQNWAVFFAFLLTNYDFKMSIGQKGNPVAFPRGVSAVNVGGEGLFDIININEVDEKW